MPVLTEWKLVQQHQIKPPDEKFKCVKCKNLLTNAMQTPCGCFICEECAMQYFDEKIKRPCPGDTEDCEKEIITKRNRPDNAKRKEIGNLEIYCPLGQDACGKWRIADIFGHLTNCAFRLVTCEACDARVQHIQLVKHKLECPNQLKVCEFCFQQFRKQEYDQEHVNPKAPKCPKFEFPCPFCAAKGPFDRLKFVEHGAVCPAWEENCEFPDCPEPFYPPKDALSHADKFRVAHLNQQAAVALLLYASAKKISHSVDKLLEDNEKQIYSSYKETNQSIVLEIESLSTYIPQGKLSQKLSAADLHSRSEELWAQIWSETGFVWTIDRFTERKRRGEKYVESPAFYGGKFPSYKLVLRISLTWDSPSERNFISVSFRFVVGRYDDILLWPFSSKIQIALQSNKTASKVAYLLSTSQECYRRPNSVEIIPYIGCQQFIDFVSLERDYLLDDTLFLTCSIVE